MYIWHFIPHSLTGYAITIIIKLANITDFSVSYYLAVPFVSPIPLCSCFTCFLLSYIAIPFASLYLYISTVHALLLSLGIPSVVLYLYLAVPFISQFLYIAVPSISLLLCVDGPCVILFLYMAVPFISLSLFLAVPIVFMFCFLAIPFVSQFQKWLFY